jgi:hypothetical protein
LLNSGRRRRRRGRGGGNRVIGILIMRGGMRVWRIRVWVWVVVIKIDRGWIR